MLKLILGLAILFTAGAGAYAQITQMPQEPQESSTRFGSLTVGEDKKLLFKGHPLKPSIDGNNSLTLSELFSINDADVVLVVNNGGSACPFMYHFITVNEAGAKATPAFGTCGELSRVKRTGGTFTVFMPGFRGPSESRRSKAKAAKETHVFIFRDGVLVEGGKPDGP
jgi:hypothetical protein